MARRKTGVALLLALAGLILWYLRRMTMDLTPLKKKQGKTKRAYDGTPIRSRRGYIARIKKSTRKIIGPPVA